MSIWIWFVGANESEMKMRSNEIKMRLSGHEKRQNQWLWDNRIAIVKIYNSYLWRRYRTIILGPGMKLTLASGKSDIIELSVSLERRQDD